MGAFLSKNLTHNIWGLFGLKILRLTWGHSEFLDEKLTRNVGPF